jgi:L-ascorbate metabolism protein UlaG (beta-lactamase superfamily)
MDIQYVGHSCFRIRGKEGVVVTDPYDSKKVGLPTPGVKADIVTISHDHDDHNLASAIKPTANRDEVFVISHPGEYEVQGITVVGYPSFHDGQQGEERGKNTMYSIFVDDVHVLHLGDLGHTLDEKTIEDIPDIDVLLCPVGGKFTINPAQAAEVISSLEPAYVVPMHFKTDQHNPETFAEMATLADFLTQYGKQASEQEKLQLSGPKSGEEEVETQLVVLTAKASEK